MDPMRSEDHEPQHPMSSAHTYPSDYSNESESDTDFTWAPGDGVCPSPEQFDQFCQSKLEAWECAASSSLESARTVPFYLNAFLSLLKDVPAFFLCPPKGVDVNGRARTFLILRSSMGVTTTEDPDCNYPHKMMDYMQCLGAPTPAFYNLKSETLLGPVLPMDAKSFRSGYFTNIVLAWSYIISCRWAEILHQAGWEIQLLHVGNVQIEDSFWDIVTHGSWVALVKKEKARFYSPWILRNKESSKDRDKWTLVAPNSSLAFNILLEFCISEGLEAELLTGLLSVFFVTTQDAPAPKFAPPIMIPNAPFASSLKQTDTSFYELYRSIDKCMFLGSMHGAMDSLACSAFFDPSVPCNLIGAASLGIEKALSTANDINNQLLLKAITYMKPHLSLFWAAVVRNDQVTAFLNLALRTLPPIRPVAAFCTGTAQSFLQIANFPAVPDTDKVSRATEFQTSYYCRTGISVPWSPAPPFGTTPIDNTSLEVRAHLGHRHRPISWIIYWNLKSGERVPASKEHRIHNFEVQSTPCRSSVEHYNHLPPAEKNDADEQSGIATSRLFNWHRDYDDGIWLDDGAGDIEFIRQIQNHAWIIDPFCDSYGDEPVEEPKRREISAEKILQWEDEVDQWRQAGESVSP